MNNLEAIEARVNGATPGFWWWEPGDEKRGPEIYHDGDGLRRSDNWIAGVYTDEDAEFLCHARKDIPALLAVVRAVLPLIDDVGCFFCQGEYTPELTHRPGCPLTSLLEETLEPPSLK